MSDSPGARVNVLLSLFTEDRFQEVTQTLIQMVRKSKGGEVGFWDSGFK